jgi:H+/Cl- antiporter ClcA
MSNKGDFTADQRLIAISAIALIIGGICAVVAVVLLKLIGFFTNLFFYGHLSFAFVSPAGNHLGAAVILIPVVGGLIIGLMARYGSDRIRGHGIPEAMEAILTRRSSGSWRSAPAPPAASSLRCSSWGVRSARWKGPSFPEGAARSGP